jgi:hypothetical protein
MQLKTCGKKGCRPVEQVRGQMGPGDYADVIASHRHVRPSADSAVNMESAQDMHLLVEMNDEIKDDVRICCLTCGKATGWQRPDAPGMPGVGIEFSRNHWNKLNGS